MTKGGKRREEKRQRAKRVGKAGDTYMKI